MSKTIIEDTIWNKSPFNQFKHISIGLATSGFLIGSIYFLWFLIGVSMAPRQSRKYLHQRHHLSSQALPRYLITIACMLTLFVLIYWHFVNLRFSIHLGLLFWILIALSKAIISKISLIIAAYKQSTPFSPKQN